ncbi:drug/metabolite transporter (DMT)-like permease [Catenulispora sp. MAP5-51]|uniref:DMT family transporter n=1 Tax=Catenulispora sp. MAP5-51 TaxID=3156298 RepID=UPI00351167BA
MTADSAATVPAAVPPVPLRVSAVHRPPKADVAVLGVAVTAVGTSGPLIAATAAPAMAIAFWRNAIAAAVFAPYVLLRANLRAELRGLGRRTTMLAIASGLILGAHFATWTPSAKLSSVASATAFAATQPIFAAIVARILGHHVPRRAFAGIGVAFAGVIVLSGVDFHASFRAFEGDLLALTAAAFAAVYMTIGGEVRKTASLPTYAFLCYGAASVFLIGAAGVTGSGLVGFSGNAWVKILALTLLAQFLGHTLFNRVVKTTSATVISTSILLEVPMAAVIAAIFLHQIPSVWAIPGAVLILGGLLLVVTANRGQDTH